MGPSQLEAAFQPLLEAFGDLMRVVLDPFASLDKSLDGFSLRTRTAAAEFRERYKELRLVVGSWITQDRKKPRS